MRLPPDAPRKECYETACMTLLPCTCISTCTKDVQ